MLRTSFPGDVVSSFPVENNAPRPLGLCVSLSMDVDPARTRSFPKIEIIRSSDERTDGNRPNRRDDNRATEASHPVVEISPTDMVRRQAMTWPGITVELVRPMSHAKIECRFRAAVHLLAVCERGMRRDGETFVE